MRRSRAASTRLLLILALVLPLGGCATLAGVTTLVAVTAGVSGAISGATRSATEGGIKRVETAVLIRRKCSRLHTDVKRRQCTNRLRYILHQYN